MLRLYPFGLRHCSRAGRAQVLGSYSFMLNAVLEVMFYLRGRIYDNYFSEDYDTLYTRTFFYTYCREERALFTDPFQIVMMLMIAEIASIPIESPDSSIFNGIAAIVMILFIYALSEFFSSKSEKFKLIINGKPAFLIDNGAINFKELNKNKITVTDLMEMLRLKDAPSISDVLLCMYRD